MKLWLGSVSSILSFVLYSVTRETNTMIAVFLGEWFLCARNLASVCREWGVINLRELGWTEGRNNGDQVVSSPPVSLETLDNRSFCDVHSTEGCLYPRLGVNALSHLWNAVPILSPTFFLRHSKEISTVSSLCLFYPPSSSLLLFGYFQGISRAYHSTAFVNLIDSDHYIFFHKSSNLMPPTFWKPKLRSWDVLFNS